MSNFGFSIEANSFLLKVVDENLVAVPNATLNVVDDDSVITTLLTNTDVNGLLVISDAYTGDITVTATASGLVDKVEVFDTTDGAEVYTITMEIAPSLTVLEYDLPNNFEQEDFKYLPAYMDQFEHFIYFNFDDPITDPDFNDWVIAVFNTTSTTPVQILGGLTKDPITGGGFRFFKKFILNTTARGPHFFAIYNQNTLAVKFQFNLFTIIGQEDVVDFTLVEYRHSSTLDFIKYSSFTEHQSIFLHMDEIDSGFEHTDKTYRERSTGKPRQQKKTRHKFVILETYLFDELANDMMASLSMHDDILLNKKEVTVRESHEADNNRDFQLGKGVISFYLSKFSSINTST